MIRKGILSIVTVLFLFGCSPQQSATGPEEAVQAETSRFDSLELRIGMSRKQVEDQVAVLLGTRKTYSPYGKNLKGGIVHYRDGDWVLEVVYKAGASAPWVRNEDGSMQHYPPVDETVMEYKKTRVHNRTN